MVTVQGRSWRVLATGAFVGLAVVLLAGIYVLLRPSSQEGDAQVPQSRSFRLDVSGDQDAMTAQAQRGVPVFRVRERDNVTIVATSTQPGSMHVHVYDRNVPLIPGGEVTLSFTAAIAGAFPIHWHDPQNLMIHLAILEVQPR